MISNLIEPQIRLKRFPGITFMEQPISPTAHVAGTGLDVWELISLLRSFGSPEEMRTLHPQISQHDIDTALAYTAAYSDEIEGAIAENERPIEEVLRDSPHIRVVEVEI